MRRILRPLLDPTPSTASPGPSTGRAVVALFLLSTCLSLLLLSRSQVGGDQLNLLGRGWLLAAEGELIPYGNPGSGGGVAPGPVTSVLVGLPLFLWRDARAPVVLIVAFHLLAFVLLDRLLARCLGSRERLLFAVFYGLSPTRLYLSGFLWNPSYLFLVGAIHVWTAFRQRHEARFFDSFLHALVLGLAVQAHASAVLLGVASLLLLLRGGMKLHWPGAMAGAAVAGLTLLPYLEAIRLDPSLLPVGTGFPGRGLLLVFPLAHGLVNWLRYSSLSVSSEVTRFDFTAVFGERADAWLAPLLSALALAAAAATVLAALAAAIWFYRRRRSSPEPWRFPAGASDREWLERYVLWSFAAAFLIFCLAPTTPMWWQGVSVMHAAVLPLVLWAAVLSAGRWRVPVRRLAWAWGSASVALLLATALGSPQFRCGGRHDLVLDLASNHPMLDGLRLRERCGFAVDAAGGWWPDVLPRSAPLAAGRNSTAQ